MTDVIYVFKYDGDKYENARKRLLCSIDSLKNQLVNIIVINNSQQKLKLEMNTSITCVHKPYEGPINKARSINYGVKNFVKSEYFLMSDIDIVYGRYHLTYMLKQIPINKPVRITHYHCEILQEFYSSDFEKLKNVSHKEKFHAPGLGLIHRPSFMEIQGYNEEFIGYSPEDQCFNERIWVINDDIRLDSNIYTFHLWHDTLRQQHEHKQKNLELWPILNKKLIANENKDWGVL